MSWAAGLQDASFGRVPFVCQTTDDDLVRRIAQHRYPYRSGADIEDMGREPRPTRIRCVFLGESYESQLGALLKMVDMGVAETFVHPILGAWKARVARASVHHEAGARDMATVELELIQDGTVEELPTVFSAVAEAKAVESAADDIDEANEEDISEATDAASALREWVAKAKSDIAKVRGAVASAQSAVAKVTDELHSIQNRIDRAVAAARALGDVQSWPLVIALKRAMHRGRLLAKALRGRGPAVVEKRVGATMPVALLAHAAYGDASRSSEILAMNRIRNPFLIPAGTTVRALSR